MPARMPSRWSVVGRAAVAVWLLVAVGCESSTGVLIEVTRDETVPARLGRLELHVGIDGVTRSERGFVDPEPEPEVRLDGRDLAKDPYRLLIRPREHPDALVMVGVVAYAGGEVAGFGALDRPVRFLDGEVALWRIVLSGDPPAGFQLTDTGCVSWTGAAGERVTIGQPRDKDCDGWSDADCDDLDPRINPGAGERCGNAVDEDCDDEIDENVDEDGDRVTTCDGDCDDRNPAVRPGAEELCDGFDNDCNDECDENLDMDADGFTFCGSRIVEGGSACLFDPGRQDCDESDADINPDAPELCDGRDNDCNAVCDDASAGLDRDGDGFTVCGSIADQCGRSELLADCQDEDAAVHPGAAELCNGQDDDCDGERLQRGPCFALDDLGSCSYGERDCAEQGDGPGDWIGDCEPRGGPVDEAPADACATYAVCAGEPEDPDPHTCSIETLDGQLFPGAGCRVAYEIGRAPCGRAEVALPPDGACTWRVVGGVDQGDYRIGLRPIDQQDLPPAGSLDVCDAVLVVETRTQDPPSPIHLLLARTVGVDTRYVPVSLAPSLVEECDPEGGLDCAPFPLLP